MRKEPKYIYISIFILLGISALLIFGSYLIGAHKLPSYGFFRRVELNVFGHTFDKISDPKQPSYYDSIFLRLYKKEIDINDRIERSGRGGGMTSFGNTVLLLSHDGKIFKVRSANDVQVSQIEPPDNGFSEYKKVALTKKYKDLTHNFELFRYNDILYYQSDKHQGIAISYTNFNSSNACYRNALAILPISNEDKYTENIVAKAEDWDIIYRSQPCLPFKRIHYALDGGTAGGRIAFRPPSTLLIGNGDYNWNGMYSSISITQDSTGHYGKIMSINLDSRESQTIATGIRNPQGIVFDRNETLWTVEHGFRGGDELNRIEMGNNYGWPLVSLGTQYSKLPIPSIAAKSYGRHSDYIQPAFAWLPSVAISNLTLIEGFHDSWDGDLLMGSLKSQSLYHIRTVNNRVLFSEKIEIGERIRYVHQHTDGRIIIWTDSKKLIFLTGKPYSDNYVTDYLEKTINNEERRKKVKITIDSCRQCHSIKPGEHTSAPSLASIFNTDIASTPYPNYSNSLKQMDGVWTTERLKRFLKNPQEFAPGTKMPATGINEEAILDDIITLLETLSKRYPN